MSNSAINHILLIVLVVITSLSAYNWNNTRKMNASVNNLISVCEQYQDDRYTNEHRHAFFALADSIINDHGSNLNTAERYVFIHDIWRYGNEFDVKSGNRYQLGLPYLLLIQAKVESGFDKRAVSPVGAVGIMQFMPSTYRSCESLLNDDRVPRTEMFDIRNQTKYAAFYMRLLYDDYGSWEKAIIKYNCHSCETSSQYYHSIDREMQKLIRSKENV